MKRVLSFILTVVILFSLSIVCMVNTSAMTVDPENKYKYDEFVIPQIFKEHHLLNPNLHVTYKEVYEYFSGNSTADEYCNSIYVLIWVSSAAFEPADMCTADLCGDYILYDTSINYPFTYHYGIYVPDTDEVYDLISAYEKGIEGIEKVFTEAGVGSLIGDMDEDGKLTVKDATFIQKIIAGIEGFTEPTIYAAEFDESLPISISDFNRDRVRNIKDATAIQKHIAGLEY